MDITLIGIPFNGDGTPIESENPARALRDAGLVRELTARSHRVTDLGDLAVPRCSGRRDAVTGVLNQEAWGVITAHSASALQHVIDSSGLLLVLGGDCAILTGVCAAVRAAGRDLGIAYIDGHADARLPEDSPSGEPADLVLTALTGRIPGLFEDLIPNRPLVSDEMITVLGYRDADRIAQFRIPAHTAADLRRRGIERTVLNGVRTFAERRAETWVHFDVDVLDPSSMPAVLFPERDGLGVEEVRAVLSTIIEAVPVLGISVACYHPRLDPDGSAAHRIVRLLAAAIPESRCIGDGPDAAGTDPGELPFEV